MLEAAVEIIFSVQIIKFYGLWFLFLNCPAAVQKLEHDTIKITIGCGHVKVNNIRL